MKKAKKGTTVKPIKNPCLDCEKATGCTVEAKLTTSAPMWRYGQPLPKISCKRYREFFKKLAAEKCAYRDQNHVSLRERLASEISAELLHIHGRVALRANIGETPLAKLISLNKKRINFRFLSQDQNKMLDLFERQGKTYREIARLMNLGRGKRKRGGFTISAVKSNMARARAKIRNHFSYSREKK